MVGFGKERWDESRLGGEGERIKYEGGRDKHSLQDRLVIK